MIERKKPGRPSKRPSNKVLEELYKDNTARQIAEMYGVATQTVKYWVHQARAKELGMQEKLTAEVKEQ